MTAVSDSGPLIHLAIVGQFLLLPRYFNILLTIPQVYDEVVTQGQGKPGASELRHAESDGWMTVTPVIDHAFVQRLATPHMSTTDAAVVACALEQQVPLVLTDDTAVRGLAERESLLVTGTVGLLVRARLDGVISALKPLLDQLIAAGFYLA
jgi:uncharacterized protein